MDTNNGHRGNSKGFVVEGKVLWPRNVQDNATQQHQRRKRQQQQHCQQLLNTNGAEHSIDETGGTPAENVDVKADHVAYLRGVGGQAGRQRSGLIRVCSRSTTREAQA